MDLAIRSSLRSLPAVFAKNEKWLYLDPSREAFYSIQKKEKDLIEKNMELATM